MKTDKNGRGNSKKTKQYRKKKTDRTVETKQDRHNSIERRRQTKRQRQKQKDKTILEDKRTTKGERDKCGGREIDRKEKGQGGREENRPALQFRPAPCQDNWGAKDPSC